jgi:hypothetical protein
MCSSRSRYRTEPGETGIENLAGSKKFAQRHWFRTTLLIDPQYFSQYSTVYHRSSQNWKPVVRDRSDLGFLRDQPPYRPPQSFFLGLLDLSFSHELFPCSRALSLEANFSWIHGPIAHAWAFSESVNCTQMVIGKIVSPEIPDYHLLAATSRKKRISRDCEPRKKWSCGEKDNIWTNQTKLGKIEIQRNPDDHH